MNYFTVYIGRGVKREVVSLASMVASEIYLYALNPLSSSVGMNIRGSLHRRFTQGGIKHFNPCLVSGTAENDRLVKCIQSTSRGHFHIVATQRLDKVFIRLSFGHYMLDQWRYAIQANGSGRAELVYDGVNKRGK